MTRTVQEAFANRLRSLFNIEGHQLPELTTANQDYSFDRDPARYFIRASDEQADAIWAEIEKRQVAQPQHVHIEPSPDDWMTDEDVRAALRFYHNRPRTVPDSQKPMDNPPQQWVELNAESATIKELRRRFTQTHCSD